MRDRFTVYKFSSQAQGHVKFRLAEFETYFTIALIQRLSSRETCVNRIINRVRLATMNEPYAAHINYNDFS